MNHRIISILIGIAIVTAVVGEALYWHSPRTGPMAGPPPADAEPALITWTPGSVTEIIAPGDTKSVSVTFTSAKNVRRASVVISPELASFVRADPSSLERVLKGQSRELRLVISAAPGTTPGTVAGTVQLTKEKGRSGEEDDDETGGVSAPLPRPLSLSVDVGARQTDAVTGISVTLGSAFLDHRVTLSGTSDGISHEVELTTVADDSVPIQQLVILVEPKNSAQTLRQWFRQNVDPDDDLIPRGIFRETPLGNAGQALLLVQPLPDDYPYIGAPLPIAPFYAARDSDSHVIVIAPGQANELDTLGFTTPSALHDLFLSLALNLSLP